MQKGCTLPFIVAHSVEFIFSSPEQFLNNSRDFHAFHRSLFYPQSADNPDALRCRVCHGRYMVEKGSQFSLLSDGFTVRQWVTSVSVVTVMVATLGAVWAVVQLYSQAWVRMVAVGAGLLVQYICLR